MKTLKEELLKLKGKVVDFAISGSTHQGTLREIGEDYLVFFKDEKSKRTLFPTNNIIWVREADKQ